MPYAIVRPRMAAIRTDAAGQPMCRSSCIARCLIGRIEDVALARVNLARDAGDEHIASLKAHRAFERRNQIAVVVFMRQRVALVGEMRSEEHTSELQSLMRISYAVFCLKKKKQTIQNQAHN